MKQYAVCNNKCFKQYALLVALLHHKSVSFFLNYILFQHRSLYKMVQYLLKKEKNPDHVSDLLILEMESIECISV